MYDILNNAEIFTIQMMKNMNKIHKQNHNKGKCHDRWLKIIASEQVEQQAAALVSRGIDYNTVASITGLPYAVVQLIGNNC